jgi:aldehyde dehydrogenase (NAD+)
MSAQNALRSVSASGDVASEARSILSRLGVPDSAFAPSGRAATSPITGETIVHVRETTPIEAKAAIGRADAAFKAWRKIPAPRRGEFVRLIGEELRASKDDLGRLVTLEAGKVTSEGLGEVQEMIDICDFAVGLSRQLYGLTIATERADHRMMETWHPLGAAASSRPSTSLWPSGRGMQRSLSCAAIPWCGSPPKRPS